MTYKQALKEYKGIGAKHATGNAARAMYADLLVGLHGGKAETYYAGLCKTPDQELDARAKHLASDRAAAWDVLMGL